MRATPIRGGRAPDRWRRRASPARPPGRKRGVRLHGDEVEIELDGGRNPRTVRVPGNPFVTSDGRELRAEQAWLDLGEDGLPERLRLRGEVTSSLPAGPDGESRIAVEADEMVIGFDGQGQLAEAQYRGAVAARHGGASASADAADVGRQGHPRPAGIAARGGFLARRTRGRRPAPHRRRGEPPRGPGSGHRALFAEPAGLASGPLRRGGPDQRRGQPRERFRTRRFPWRGCGCCSGGTASSRRPSRWMRARAPSTPRAGSGAPSKSRFRRRPSRERRRGPPAPADSGGDADGGSRSPPEGETFAFDARAERFSFLAAESRLSWEGAPRLEQRSAAGGVSRVSAGRIEAELRDGSLAAIVGEHGAPLRARGERGEGRPDPIRARPGPSGGVGVSGGDRCGGPALGRGASRSGFPGRPFGDPPDEGRAGRWRGSRCGIRAAEESRVFRRFPRRRRRRGRRGARGGSAPACLPQAGEELRTPPRGGRGRGLRRERRGRGSARPQRGGEDHHFPHDRGAHPAGERRGVPRRPRVDRAADAPAGALWGRLPAAGAVHLPRPHGRGEPDGDPRTTARNEPRRAPRAGGGTPRRLRARRAETESGRRPFGRGTPPRRNCPRPGAEPRVPPARRALRRD